MSRDAIPQHEIDGIVSRLAGGEPLQAIKASSPTIARSWFDRNEKALLKRAGVTPPAGEGDAAGDEEKAGKAGKAGKK